MKLGYLQRLRMIFWIMFSALFVYFAAVLFIHSYNSFTANAQIIPLIQFAIPAVAVIGLMLSSIFYKMKIRTVRQRSGLNDKLSAYKDAVIIKLACLEGPALFAAIAFLLTSSFLHLAIAAFMMAAMWLNKPTKVEIRHDLKLEDRELNALKRTESSFA